LLITATPPSAQVSIGEHPPLTLPYSEPVWAGTYEIHARELGFETQNQTVEVADGGKAELHIELAPSPRKTAVTAAALPPVPTPLDKPTGRARRPGWRLGLGSGMITAGLGMTIIGGLGISVDNTCIGHPAMPLGMCPQLYDTRVPGSVALASGLVLVGSGILLIALPGSLRQ
jgi:hypothetical protein